MSGRESRGGARAAIPATGRPERREESPPVSRDERALVSELESFALDPAVRPSAIAGQLDALPASLRTAVVRGISRRAQRGLYEKVRGFGAVELRDLVPPERGDLETVRHLGRNTLPAFTLFEKHFCRLPGASRTAPQALAGFNFQALSRLTGPGYFVAVADLDRAEVLVDYRRLPTVRPASWPPIRSNETGLARFVYGFMVDRLRRVARDVTIGSAARRGRELGSYFVLSREA
ncbi:MAG: hypothetical protein IPK00_20545 [Deltaproteobacteria bacterium]|nr:hypothetical protein [Deltaproteobacteria bacterium]